MKSKSVYTDLEDITYLKLIVSVILHVIIKNENEVLIISTDLNVPKSQIFFCFTDEEKVIYRLGSHR